MVQALPAQDSQRWITDQLEVDMRRGQSTRHAIIRMVPSATAVTVLQTDAATGYSRIRTPSGAEGWVLSRYLLSQPPARLAMPALEARLASLQQEHAELTKQTQELRRERDELQRQLQGASAKGQALEKDLAEVRELSAGAVDLAEQNRQLTARAGAAEQRAGELEVRNRELSDQGRRSWFLAGAAVLLAGLLLGLVLPRVRWKKKNGW
jgi:SH3 domain protein